jgi:hypothetical protein
MRTLMSLLLVAALAAGTTAIMSCSNGEEDSAGTVSSAPSTPPADTGPDEPTDETTDETTDEPAEEPTDDVGMTPEEIVDTVGLELPEGAEPVGTEATEDGPQASYEVDQAYNDVKEYYLGTIGDWDNNGFEMGAMGGNGWEFNDPTGAYRITLNSESNSPPTTIEYLLLEGGSDEGTDEAGE